MILKRTVNDGQLSHTYRDGSLHMIVRTVKSMIEDSQERMIKCIENIEKTITNLRKKLQHYEAVKQYRLYQLYTMERNVINEFETTGQSNKTRAKE